MADTVRYLMEAMLPELEDLARKGYFTRDEVRAIARRREDFEYALKRRSPVKADFLRYAEYERALDALREHRRAALLARASVALRAAREQLKKGAAAAAAEGEEAGDDGDEAAAAAAADAAADAATMTKAQARRRVAELRAERDALRRASAADHGARRRVHFVYERATRRFRRDASLWAAWLDYCRETKSGRRLSRVAAKALRAMPHEPGFWVAAAAWEFDGAGDPHAARALMQRGLRECRRDARAAARMWESYAGMEVAYVARMRARREVLGLSLPGEEEDAEGEAAAAADAAAVEAAREGAAAREAERQRQDKDKERKGGRKRRMPRDGEGDGEEEDEEDDISESSSEGAMADEDLEEEDDEDEDEEGEEGGKKKKTRPGGGDGADGSKPTAAELSKAGDDKAAADAVLRGAVVRAVVRAAARALPGDLGLRLRLAALLDGEEAGGDGGRGGSSGNGSGGGSGPPFPGAKRIADEVWAGIAADFPTRAAAWDARARRAFALAARAAAAATGGGGGGEAAWAAGEKAAAAVFEEGVAAAAAAAAGAGSAAAAAGELWAAYCTFLRERLDAALARVATASAEEEAAQQAAEAANKNNNKKKKGAPAKEGGNVAPAASAALLAAARRAAALLKACARADAAFESESEGRQRPRWPLPPAFYAQTWAGGARAAGQPALAERAARLAAERRHPRSARAWLALLEAVDEQQEREQGASSSSKALLWRALDAVGVPSDGDYDDCREQEGEEEEEAAALLRLWERAAGAAAPAGAAASAFARLWASRARRAGPPSGSAAGLIAERLLRALWAGGVGVEAGQATGGGGPSAARALYARLRLLPPPGGELFRAMARLEDEGGSPARARAALEDGAAAYGDRDVGLWLQYAELAGRGGAEPAAAKAAGGGGPLDVAARTAQRGKRRQAAGGSSSSAAGEVPTVGDVHFRAVRALGAGPRPQLADEFAAAWAARQRGGGGA